MAGFAADAVVEGQSGDGAAGEKAGCHAEGEGWVVLVQAVDDADDLQDAEAAESDERDAFVGLLAPDRDDLRDEEQGVAEEA